jgi:hypothetical protein
MPRFPEMNALSDRLTLPMERATSNIFSRPNAISRNNTMCGTWLHQGSRTDDYGKENPIRSPQLL